MKKSENLAKSTLAIIIFALLGKILGFVRESLIASVFGAGVEKSAFVLSQSATGLISAIITTAIATTFIPQLNKVESDLGGEHKLKFTNNMLAISTVISIAVVVLGVFFARYISMLTAYTAEPEVFELVVKLTRIGLIGIVFSAWVGIFTGYLQYEGRFAAAGGIAIPLNLVSIVYLIVFSGHLGINGLTIAAVAGILAQLFFLLPSSFKVGYKFFPVFDFRNKYVKETLILSLPVLVSVSINDINVLVNKSLAAGMDSAAPSILDYANKLNLMILGIFITAITAVIFPIMSREFGSGNMQRGKKVMNTSVKTVLFLTIPATVGLIVFARPFVEIAYLRGRFTPEDAIRTTSTLRFYTLALISMSVSNVLNRVYYSISDTKTPFYIGAFNVVVNVLLNILVAHKFGTQGLAASVSIATTAAVFLSFVLLKKKIGNLGTKSYIKALVKTLMASTIMGLFCLIYFPIESLIVPMLHGNAAITLFKLILLLAIVAMALVVYFVVMYFLGVREIRDLKKFLVDKVKNKLENRN